MYEAPAHPKDGEVIASLAIDDVDPPRAVGDPELERSVADARAALEEEDATLRPAREATLAGEPARVTEGTTASGARVRQLVAVRGERIYTVTLVAAAEAFADRAAAYDQVISSWRWD